MVFSNASLALFGPLLIGAFLNTILYGVCVVQCYTYYQKYKRDARPIRYLVLYLFIMETCNTAFNIALVFDPLVLNFGNPQSFVTAPKFLFLDAISTVSISTPVQFFAAWRIYVVSESIIMPLIIGFFGTCSFIGGCALSIAVSILRDLAGFKRFQGAAITWLSASAAADLLITASLCWSLYRWKTGMQATDDKVSKIVRLTMQTGLLTTTFALLDIIVATTVRGIDLNFAWDLALSKLYTNSLLSTLNARDGWNGNLAVPSSNLMGGRLSGQVRTSQATKLSTLAFRQNIAAGMQIDEDDVELGSLESAHQKGFRS